MKLYRPPTPSSLRVALVATLVAGGALALYRRDPTDRWIAVTAGVLAVLMLLWWRGTFVTSIVGKWVGMLTRRLSRRKPSDNADIADNGADARTTVVLELDSFDQEIPIDVISGYLDRYGVRCSSIRITSAEVDGAPLGTWLSLTVSASDNLAALQARSPRIPLRETAETVGRRMADHLRELGQQVRTANEPPRPFAAAGKEQWGSVADDRGHLAVYRVAVSHDLADTLAAVRSTETTERWITLVLSGRPEAPAVAVLCALRSSDRPRGHAPVNGLVPCWGDQARVLQTINPLSNNVFHGRTTIVTSEFLSTLPLPVGMEPTRV